MMQLGRRSWVILGLAISAVGSVLSAAAVGPFWGNTLIVLTGFVVAGGAFLFLGWRRRRYLAWRRRAGEWEGRRLGGYLLERKLSHGAMGIVYLARDERTGNPAVVKLILPAQGGSHPRKWQQREVILGRSLKSRHTAAIYDHGKTREGIFYVVMEYVDGITLQALVQREGPQAEARVASVLEQLAAVLHEINGAGWVHRDVAPSNVLLSRQGGKEIVKLLDFGLAREIGRGRNNLDSAPDFPITGTPGYMSPESLRQPESVDGRTDLYSLGALGYYLLTGRPVFDEVSDDELYHRHIRVVPENPSVRLDKPVEPILETLLMRCLSKNPEDRPANAEAFLAELTASGLSRKWDAAAVKQWWEQFSRPEWRGAQDAKETRRIEPKWEAEGRVGIEIRPGYTAKEG